MFFDHLSDLFSDSIYWNVLVLNVCLTVIYACIRRILLVSTEKKVFLCCNVSMVRFSIALFFAGFSHQLTDEIKRFLHVFIAASFYK